MYSNYLVKSFRILLLPFSLIYWFILMIRNKLFDKDILPSASFGLPVICIGNLSVGGTGKSPMVEYLAGKLKNEFRIAILSRGYKRKTKGYTLAGDDSTALDIGDEPMQFHLKFPDIPVAVGEERLYAIPQLLHDQPGLQCILLDDAFQHRSVRAGLNILLTDHQNLFTRDFYLPAGDLRDLKSSYKRAEILVVSKCPPGLTDKKRQSLEKEIKTLPHQSIYFTANKYANPYHLISKKEMQLLKSKYEVLLVTGIANPQPLKELVQEITSSYSMLQFPDHHIFTIDDWKEIRGKFDLMQSENKIILTTEKDAVRLVKFSKEIGETPVYVIPLSHHVLFNKETAFVEQVRRFIREFNKAI